VPSFSPTTKLALPVIIMAASLLAFALPARLHTLGGYDAETDFYFYYAPAAERISVGEFPREYGYHAPGYSALVALVSLATGDLFVSGKWISVVSAALAGLLVFLLFSRAFGYWAGVGAQLILLVSGPFPRYALSASTDMVFLMLCLAALVCFTTNRVGPRWRAGSAGVVTAAACLVRYNGVFLVPPFLLAILVFNAFGVGRWKQIELAAVLLAAIVFTTAPWLYLNNRHNGSPFYNISYVASASLFYSDLVGGRFNEDGNRMLSGMFHSFGDVLLRDPRRILLMYPVNLLRCLRNSLTGNLVGLPVAGLALAGTIRALGWRRSIDLRLMLSAGACYFLVMAFVPWLPRYFLFVAAIYAGLASLAVTGAFETAQRWRRGLGLVVAAIAGAVWLGTFAQAHADVSAFLADPSRAVVGACHYLEQRGASQVSILARKPHLPYVCRQEWVFFPMVSSLDELRRWLETHPVDYVAFGYAEQQHRPELAELLEPGRAPSWLKVVWSSQTPPFVLYVPAFERVR
jgi:hypothetical protein